MEKKLHDKNLAAAQKIIKQQFPHGEGLVDTVVLSNNGTPCPAAQEAVKIYHAPDHWVMSCSFGGSVTVYDSTNTTLTPSLRRQIALV